jgi:ABC-2 type transport system ATP-binding protein
MSSAISSPIHTRFTAAPHNGMAITARGLAKTYGQKGSAPKDALKGIDLDIPVGCVFGLLGANGAGKSTFINIMGGTVIKSAGQVSIWGTDIDENPRQSRANIGIVPQELNIDAFFSPRETLELMSGLFGVPKSEWRIDEILDMVSLTEQADSYARHLSGGMRRRLLVAKAMVHSPPILVLDEPTAGVDVSLRQRLWDNILTLRDSGVTVVLTTHYLEEAEALCDHVAIIDKGNVITSKPKLELMQEANVKELHLSLTSSPPAPLPDALIELGATWQDGTLQIRFNPREISAGAIIGKVTTLGLEIGDVSTQETDLEDVFLALTAER